LNDPTNLEADMTMQRKKQAKKFSTPKKIADARVVRYGTGSISPSLQKRHERLTHDSGNVRFGTGSIAPSLRK